MGVIRVTARPSKYAAEEDQEKELIQTNGIQETEEYWDVLERDQLLAGRRENKGFLTFRLEVGGIRDLNMRYKQKRILPVVNQALHEKGAFVRNYCNGDDYGFYQWKQFTLHGNVIKTAPFSLEEIDPVLKVLQRLDEAGWYPEQDIEIRFTPLGGGPFTVFNLVNILESRQRLIEEALSLKEPLQIVLHHDVALSISLSAFSYPRVEASAYLMAQACRMAETMGKARMKPCDMSNPRFQMRSWLLRLGFIGEAFERPRRTLLEALDGDSAFFTDAQKQSAMMKRKTRQEKAL